MKKGDYAVVELRERTDAELRLMENQLYEDLFKLRIGRATNQLENTSKITHAKRALGRVKTLLNARKLGLEASKKDTREEA